MVQKWQNSCLLRLCYVSRALDFLIGYVLGGQMKQAQDSDSESNVKKKIQLQEQKQDENH